MDFSIHNFGLYLNSSKSGVVSKSCLGKFRSKLLLKSTFLRAGRWVKERVDTREIWFPPKLSNWSDLRLTKEPSGTSLNWFCERSRDLREVNSSIERPTLEASLSLLFPIDSTSNLGKREKHLRWTWSILFPLKFAKRSESNRPKIPSAKRSTFEFVMWICFMVDIAAKAPTGKAEMAEPSIRICFRRDNPLNLGRSRILLFSTVNASKFSNFSMASKGKSISLSSTI